MEQAMDRITHWIDGKPWDGKPERSGPVYDPARGEVVAEVAFADRALVDHAVEVAARAARDWRESSLATRAKVLFAFRDRVERNKKEIAALVTREHGKVLADAAGSVSRGLEVVEFAC